MDFNSFTPLQLGLGSLPGIAYFIVYVIPGIKKFIDFEKSLTAKERKKFLKIK